MKKQTLKPALALALFALPALSRGEVLLPDPAIAVFGGKYHLLGTEHGRGADMVKKRTVEAVFPLYVSDDSISWRLAETPLGEGRLLSLKDAFGKANFWAPQLFARNGRYYLAYTCDFHWGLAVADAPTGPFRRYAEFGDAASHMIDPFVLQDHDGRLYAYFSGIQAVELSSDMKSFIGKPAVCVVNDRPWERVPLEKEYDELNRRFKYTKWSKFTSNNCTVEGPSVIRRRGKYVLFYSANDFRSPDYCVCAAVSDRPLGPWKKLQEGPVLSRRDTGLNGTGHGDVYEDKDGELWYVFHAHNSSIRIHPRRTGVIKLVESTGEDGYPRYRADPMTMRLY